MKRETLEKITLNELRDLLVERTLQLLESMDQKADGLSLRDQKDEVELIREIINQKRLEQPG
ncbi:MAG TPA: hypothetical protein VGI82_13530 [Chitinophagaceae bacterium]|jgi:hypothetical protein